MIRLTLRSGGPLSGVQMLAADGYTVPTVLLRRCGGTTSGGAARARPC